MPPTRGPGCATGYVQYGNNTASSRLVPASGKGDLYQTYNQQLATITFSGMNRSSWSCLISRIRSTNSGG